MILLYYKFQGSRELKKIVLNTIRVLLSKNVACPIQFADFHCINDFKYITSIEGISKGDSGALFEFKNSSRFCAKAWKDVNLLKFQKKCHVIPVLAPQGFFLFTSTISYSFLQKKYAGLPTFLTDCLYFMRCV